MRVLITPRAEEDVIRQFRYYLLDQDAPDVALEFRKAVFETLAQLREFPLLGSASNTEPAGLRSWPVKGFPALRLYYILTTSQLRIIRVLHCKRDVRRILRTDPR